MLYFNVQRIEKYSTAMCWLNLNLGVLTFKFLNTFWIFLKGPLLPWLPRPKCQIINCWDLYCICCFCAIYFLFFCNLADLLFPFVVCRHCVEMRYSRGHFRARWTLQIVFFFYFYLTNILNTEIYQSKKMTFDIHYFTVLVNQRRGTIFDKYIGRMSTEKVYKEIQPYLRNKSFDCGDVLFY